MGKEHLGRVAVGCLEEVQKAEEGNDLGRSLEEKTPIKLEGKEEPVWPGRRAAVK